MLLFKESCTPAPEAEHAEWIEVVRSQIYVNERILMTTHRIPRRNHPDPAIETGFRTLAR